MLSGDSTVRFFSFNGKKLEFIYDDYDTDAIYRVVVDTPIVYSEVTGGDGCVHMRIENSSEKLDIDEKSRLFVLPREFSKQMAVITKGYHVLAGLKANEYPKLFILQGNGIIALCPIADEAKISIEKA